AYKLLHVLTYSYHEFIHDVNGSEEYSDGLTSSSALDTFFLHFWRPVLINYFQLIKVVYLNDK
ncbi:MAG: hypothetical protein M3146_01320, partial [Thermoproteota archaeon]|nr:hypothetical protein [Thermoproteota archaeon]